MSYQVLRVTQKTHDKGQMHLCQRENNRDESMKDKGLFELSNIDWSKTNTNYYLVKSENFYKDFEAKLKEYGITSYKSNAVKTINGVVTFSPEILEKMTHDEMMNYFSEAVDFLNRHMGVVINAVIHFDEKTPHMHFTTIPIVQRNGKYSLCAREICGGKKKMAQLQTDFNNEVAHKYGLERGVSRTPTDGTRKHKGALEHQLDVLQNKIDELENNALELTGKITYLKKDKKDLSRQLMTLQRDNFNLQNENNYLFSDNEKLQKHNKDLEEDITVRDAKLARLESQIELLKDKEYYTLFIDAKSQLNKAEELIKSKEYATAELFTKSASKLLNDVSKLYQMEREEEDEYER